MEDFRIAVKAFIISEDKLLLIKRASNDTHKPGVWDIPGGRLEVGEDPIKGIIRETQEETGLDIEVVMPIDVHHFTRDDGQKITMIIFLCKAKSIKIKLSDEHEESAWINLKNPGRKIPEWLEQTVKNVLKFVKLEELL